MSKTSSLTRRNLLKTMGLLAGGQVALRTLNPSLLIAEGPAPSSLAAGQFFINIVLAGGADGLYLFPPLGSGGNLFNILKARRPSIMSAMTAASVAIPGLSSEIGLHTNFRRKPAGMSSSVADLVAAGQARVLGRVGMAQLDGSHDSAMATLLTGLTSWNAGSSGHWVSRWMDAYAMQPTQVWRFGRQVGFPLTRSGALPISVDNLAQYQWNDRGSALGGSAEATRSFDVAKRLLDLQPNLSPHAEHLRTALEETIQTSNQLTPYRNQATRSDYTYLSPFRDAARVINRKIATADTSTTYVQLSFDGFDTHSSQAAGLDGASQMLADNLSVFYEELKNTAWSKTVVVISTEFGRKIPTGAESGSDHGWANNSLVLSGGLRSGAGALAGALPLASDLQNGNVLTTAIDQRQTFWEILEFLGHDPARVFTDHTPSQRLRLFGI